MTNKKFDTLYIEFEEENEESLNKAIAEAKRLGYKKFFGRDNATSFRGYGVLALDIGGYYYTVNFSYKELEDIGYKEHKIKEDVKKEKTNKETLIKHLKNPSNKLICVDLDGTLCEGQFWGEGEPKPIQSRIDYVNSIYKKGAHIVIYTARSPEFYQVTHAWLIKYGVKFHGISMQHKPGADVYIDDKAINVDDIF